MSHSLRKPNYDSNFTAFEKENENIIIEKNSKIDGKTRQYLKGKFLGKGGFAKCYEITDLESKNMTAAKVIAKSTLIKNRAKQKLMTEIKIHKSLNHTNIVNFEHYFEDGENVYILLEICTNQTMNELLRRRKRLTEFEVQVYLLQMISVLKYLHKNRVIHRDLKLGNLFLSEKMEIKLGDFGLASKLDYEGEKKRTICGTPNYIAPEILEGKTGHSYEVDIWSLGVILYTLLIGKPPFETSDVKTTYKRIKINAYSFPEHVTISSAAKSLIHKILNLQPEKRPTLDEILNHEFLANHNCLPRLLPISTLACPPSSSFVKQYSLKKENEGNSLTINSNSTAKPPRLENTTPNSAELVRSGLREKKDFINTERANLISSQNFNKCVVFDINNINNAQINVNEKLTASYGESANKGKNSVLDRALATENSKEHINKIKIDNPINSINKSPLNAGLILETNNKKEEKQYNEIYVKKWVDYSTKYGLGYSLSNGMSGVYFNDSTKILLDCKKIKMQYVERKSSDSLDHLKIYSIDEYPKEIQKKVTLLQHFTNYLENGEDIKERRQSEANINFFKSGNLNEKDSGSNIYVKKWLKTKHAIIFRLSNKMVQVIFQDQTEILLNSELKLVTYVNKKQERLKYPLSVALESTNPELSKRLKYTKDILSQMLEGKNTKEVEKEEVIKKEEKIDERKYIKNGFTSNGYSSTGKSLSNGGLPMYMSNQKCDNNNIDFNFTGKYSSSNHSNGKNNGNGQINVNTPKLYN